MFEKINLILCFMSIFGRCQVFWGVEVVMTGIDGTGMSMNACRGLSR